MNVWRDMPHPEYHVYRAGANTAMKKGFARVKSATNNAMVSAGQMLGLGGGKLNKFLGGAINGFNEQETLAFANRVISRENKNGKLDTVNPWGYTGNYQFGASALAETGFIDKNKLARAPKGVKNGSDKVAHKAFLADSSNWIKGNWEQYKHSQAMQDESFRKLVELNIKSGASVHGYQKDKMLGYAMAAHLKGAGNANKWYKHGIDSHDANGTRTSDYAKYGEGTLHGFSSKDIAEGTGQVPFVTPPVGAKAHHALKHGGSSTHNTINSSTVIHKVNIVADKAEHAGKAFLHEMQKARELKNPWWKAAMANNTAMQ